MKTKLVMLLPMLFIVATLALGLGLCGCAEPEPKVPIPIDQGWLPDIRQVLAAYATLVEPNGKTVGVTDGVQKARGLINLKYTQPMTRSQALKFIEQCLREQAGVIVVHRDRKHIIFGLSGDPDKHVARWLSPH